ncbi:hypothetical protein [Roseibaca sp. Y0-43]|uniref:hypothetical protein n=1 Tax=Roseibaca sp. Y0-43 TaxID=2816854 RepID=UPI001D0CCF7C|nr:hypothetical protein [Roseibaca sp. Y0-43]MCC1482766.1 hypothetical protein [Roseibaca sp. Y0-43]
MSKPPHTQAINKIISVAKATRGRVQHLTLNGINALQLAQSFGGAPCALAGTTEIEDKKGHGQHDEGQASRPPRPRLRKQPDRDATPHQRSPFLQLSTRAQTATAIPPGASAMNS